MFGNLRYYFEVMIGKRRADNFPMATSWIILSCCVIWIAEIVSPAVVEWGAMYRIAAPIQPWRYFTAMFLHATTMGGAGSFINPLHIGLNMYTLWILGRILEPYLGRTRFIFVYLFCGLGSAILPMLVGLFDPATLFVSSVGASGAVMGLFSVLVMLYRRLNFSYTQLLFVAALNIFMPFFMPNIDWTGHLAGFITGLALSIGLGFTRIHVPLRFRANQFFALILSALGLIFIIIEVIWLVILFNLI
jgi:membrane associated rhomboid family serine protease